MSEGVGSRFGEDLGRRVVEELRVWISSDWVGRSTRLGLAILTFVLISVAAGALPLAPHQATLTAIAGALFVVALASRHTLGSTPTAGSPPATAASTESRGTRRKPELATTFYGLSADAKQKFNEVWKKLSRPGEGNPIMVARMSLDRSVRQHGVLIVTPTRILLAKDRLFLDSGKYYAEIPRDHTLKVRRTGPRGWPYAEWTHGIRMDASGSPTWKMHFHPSVPAAALDFFT